MEPDKSSRLAVSTSIFWMGLVAFAVHQFLHAMVVFLHGDAPYLFCQYDCAWYVDIIKTGYMLDTNVHVSGHANWAFFPLFPLIGGTVEWITGIPAQVAAVLSAKVLWILAIWAFLAFQREYLPASPLWIGAAFLILNPAAIYANNGYTEPLFLLLSCLSLTAMRQGRPVMAGAFGALLTATRAVGVGVGLAFAVYALTRVIRKPDVNAGKLLFAGMLIPLGLAGYMVFLHVHVGDALAFSHVQRAWYRELSSPLFHLKSGLGGDTYSVIMVLTAHMGFIMVGYLAWKGEWGLALFLLFATAIPLSTGTMSMGRYVMMQPAFLLAVVMLMYNHRWLCVLLIPSTLGYLWMSYAWQESLFFVT